MATIKNQTKTYRTEYLNEEGMPCVLIATVRHDDSFGNGHNTFAITGELYDQPNRRRREPSVVHKETGKRLWLGASGCIHDEIAKRIPELAPFIKWHLCSTDGPMHYITNTIYLAGDRDYRGLRKGETRQIRKGGNGPLLWKLAILDNNGCEVSPEKYVDSDTPPTGSWTAKYVPFVAVGEGKERELDAARRVAVWPEATDEELCAPPDELRAKLEARLPALIAEFKRDVESLGLVF